MNGLALQAKRHSGVSALAYLAQIGRGTGTILLTERSFNNMIVFRVFWPEQ
jgi:hypothetical protein